MTWVHLALEAPEMNTEPAMMRSASSNTSQGRYMNQQLL